MTRAVPGPLSSDPGFSTAFIDDDYPSGDGKPMAETDFHRDVIFDLIDRLKRWYADRPDVYVASNNFLYYEQFNRRRHISPDVYVVFGVPNHPRPR